MTTVTGASASTTVHVKTTVVNQGAAAQSVTVQAIVIDPSGAKLAPVTSTVQSVGRVNSVTFAVDVPVANPKLWSLASPNMYQVQTTVLSGSTGLDDDVTPFGIRTIKFDPETGFYLNGVSVKIKGACLHHDMSALGAAVPQRAIQRRLAILKTLGVNAIRTAHNPEDPEMLDVCDRMGLLVLDEFFDVWTEPKYNQIGDYAAYFNKIDPVTNQKWYQTDVIETVKRHRNHPCILFYSIGNEIRDALSIRDTAYDRHCEHVPQVRHRAGRSRRRCSARNSGDYPGGLLEYSRCIRRQLPHDELLSAITGTTPAPFGRGDRDGRERDRLGQLFHGESAGRG